MPGALGSIYGARCVLQFSLTDPINILLSFSAVIQIAAIVLAVRMVNQANDRRPWLVMIMALGLMLVIRLLGILLGPEFRLYSGPFSATLLSILLLIAMIMFRTVAKAERESQALAVQRGAERDQSESRYRSLVELSPDVMFVHDGRSIVYANSAALRFFGAKSASELIGRSPVEFVVPELRDTIQHRIDALLKDGGTVPLSEQKWKRLDGSEVEVDAVGTVIPWRGGWAIQSILRDITHRKELERRNLELLADERAARSSAESANRIKDEFLATLSHELRTPLTAILGWSYMLQKGFADIDELNQGLTTIERAARSQTRIVDDLLDMSRIISGKLRLDVQRVLPETVIEAAIDTVQPAADAKGIHLRKTIDPHAGPIMGDPNRIQQIVWNLLSNSIKFTPKNGSVHVTLARVNSHIEIAVTDSGDGIAAEFLPLVFDRFRQADASYTRKHGGLGLGLAIVKQLAELHGGKVRAHSDGPGTGSTFTIELPLASTASMSPDRLHPHASYDAPQLGEAPDLSGVQVLVVDDEPDAKNLIKRVLDESHAVVRTAGSAAEALEMIQTERPQVLISDIGMPGMDGYEFIKRVRNLSSAQKIPAIALTAFARSEDRARALLAGYSVHVSKPVEPTELLATVASLAGRTAGV